ncbi:hypothetical protein CRUP_036408 [Coryphaenoides rupestris]|nr:hypothetical protein CRUP_036408 [Coryphaenoides rupestris]
MQMQFSWDDKAVRRIFIRKVYAILMTQLLVTVAIVSLFTFSTETPFCLFYLLPNSVTFLATYIALTCCGDLSFHSKFDFTSCQGVLFALCVVMLLCAITLSIVIPFGYVPWLHAVYSVIGAVLFTLFLAFDTQMLLGNKRYSMSPEEYIFATLNLYLDVVYLFTFLLQCSGGGRE